MTEAPIGGRFAFWSEALERIVLACPVLHFRLLALEHLLDGTVSRIGQQVQLGRLPPLVQHLQVVHAPTVVRSTTRRAPCARPNSPTCSLFIARYHLKGVHRSG
eukprot:TRINITY_DN3293_c1_g1_i1.p2 TRINITY_DN3293_c1_g1~~TRINITY_DN3293_c1_g1_i1.p2  ORF type:complete len:104 (+),score=0.99 TRINITY_DN3293_c1_g1_i1:260-571(+)